MNRDFIINLNHLAQKSNDYLSNNFESIAPALIEDLIQHILKLEKFEVVPFEDGRRKGAAIYYSSDGDHSMELRRYKNEAYELNLSIIIEDNPIFYRYRLSEDDIFGIPNYIQEHLKKAYELCCPITVKEKAETE